MAKQQAGTVHQGWNVYLAGQWVVTKVFYVPTMDAEEVKRSLVDHDGYNPSITVRRDGK